MKFVASLLLALALGVNSFTPMSPRVAGRGLKLHSTATAPALEQTLATAANEARGLAMDSIAAAESGHLGLPLGAAEIGAVLWGQSMTYNPDEPTWVNRDRFVLSAGHGSMFLYSWLHMAGYDLPKDEVANFRQWHSATPGHPEFPNSEHTTPGIEATTGPLGAGIGNAVGLAASEKMAAARFNTDDHKSIDHHVYVLCGDGCLQEGVSAEAMSFAAHEKLDNLILLFDSNDVTLDKMAEFTQSEDHAQRFEAYGWDVITLTDGHDLKAIHEAIEEGKNNNNGKPTAIICKTIIGKGIDEVAGTNAAHGEAGVAFVEGARKSLGLPEEKWYVSPETYDFFAEHKKSLVAKYDEWQSTFAAWKGANAELAKELEDAVAGVVPDLDALMPYYEEPGKGIATRNAGAEVLQPVAQSMPFYVSGSADLHGSNKNYMKEVGDFSKSNYAGRNFYYGIREHAMGAIMNGMAFYGGMRVSGSTFLVFSGYMMGSVRVAALSGLPVKYIWTHDSIGVGEDGPTHQPVEVVAGLRAMPNLDVLRPGDAEETAAAYIHAMKRTDGPCAMILSRQDLPVLEGAPSMKREGALKGGYILQKETAELTHILLAVGSEVSLAVEAAKELGAGCRIVSMPCVELFERQDAAYQAEVLPNRDITTAVEAGYTHAWYKFAAKVHGVDTFGISAPAQFVFEAKEMTVPGLLAKVNS